MSALIEGTLKATLAAAHFHPECTGHYLFFVFEFRLEGKETDKPMAYTMFEGPNRFVITSQPSIPDR